MKVEKKIMKHKFFYVFILTYLFMFANVKPQLTLSNSKQQQRNNINKINKNFQDSSFVEMSEKSSLASTSNINSKNFGKELNKLENKMRDKLNLNLAPKRGKKRYTIDNRLCQNPFKHKGDYYFDCTDAEAPDSSQTGKEWCFVDTPGSGEKIWEFCQPILDYDKVREHAQNEMKKISIDAKKLNDDINNVVTPAQSALDQLRTIKDSQASMSTKLGELAKDINVLQNNINNLNDLKNRWKKLEDQCSGIAENIEKKVIEKIKTESNNFSKPLEPTQDTLKNEEVFNKQKINPALQFKNVDGSYDCSGKLLYEDQGDGDGVTAQYFDNGDFLGEFIEVKEANVDFDWSGDVPVQNINPNIFSVRFEGYVLAPVSSNYYFSVECDDACQVQLNNEPIISHKFSMSTVENKSRVDKWLHREANSKLSSNGEMYKSKSQKMNLLGGNKYKIVVLYSHSVHNDSQDLGRSFLKLLWGSEEFTERLISKKDFYTQNSTPPIKITGINSDEMIVRKLLENDLAFKDSKRYILQDIPLNYLGATALKLNTKYKQANITFELNVAAYVYIARLSYYPNCVSKDWENTGERLSILDVSTPKTLSTQSKFEANRSGVMKIYRKKFDSGLISIPLNRQNINSRGIPLIVFFGSDTSLMNLPSCGGSELWISDPSGIHYGECTSSSFWESNWKCENGLNGLFRDSEGGMWATRREGIGAWIEVTFKNTFHMTRVELKNRRNSQERNSLIEISFSNGRKQLVKLPNTEDIMSVPLDPPVKSNTIRFTVKGVYGTINNGGSFKVFGLECKDIDNDVLTNTNYINTSNSSKIKTSSINPKLISPLFKQQERPPVLLLCKDSLSNMKKLDHVRLKPGAQVKVRCFETCSQTRFPIYGDKQYSKDSSICKAAYHSGILTRENQLIFVKFSYGLHFYPSVMRSGVKSKSKGYSELTLSFENAFDPDNIIINSGTKLDILDPSGSGTYLPVVIIKVLDSDELKKLTVTIEGTDGTNQKILLNYPNKNSIFACGTKINGRNCDGSLVDMDINRPIRIKFQPQDKPSKNSYLVDNGLTFGRSGKAYGWDRDMTNRLRYREGAADPMLETLVEFPPDANSKYCNVDRPEVVCDQASWSAKVGFGRFNVKLHIGDTMSNTRVDLIVNGIPLVKERTIEKGKLEIFEGEFDSINEFITITSKCFHDCDYSMSKLNMIEISPKKNVEEVKIEPKPVVEDPCGNAQYGGKCDTGPDVTHCLFDDPSTDTAKYCSGNAMMIQVPNSYKCASQRNKYKCVLRQYDSNSACLTFCPYKCVTGYCNV